MSKHTPGPWHLTQTQLWSDRPYCFQITFQASNFEASQLQANANLIAAAPDLLEALESAIGDLFYQIEAKHGAKAASKYPSIASARAAIARAKGEK